ncbi:WD40-like Beta Propeller Repeat [Maribacter sedimenticola]|uniref:WD40-like Beta Propeller Repeat n=2 Tax=Maribacter sedimenticola TaxID=228956 RepID=A0ABY1SEP9_9FLAO|nr:WD40-like Beta Propeller Repeat [Maribacter sedimenticola]
MTNLLDSTKMKKTIILIITVLGTYGTIWGQHEVDRANDLFEKAYYTDAIPLYEAALPMNKSSVLIKNLADSYYHTFNLNASARWYRNLISNYGDTVNEEYFFRLNQSLKAIGEYKEAEKVLGDYYSKEGQTDKLLQLRQSSTYLDNVKAIGERYTIENSALNTGTSEFGAMSIGNEMWYTAAHKNSKSKTYRWNNQQYLDIYTHPLEKQMWGDSLSSELPGQVNTRLHEGTFTLSSDRKTLYFTRNNFKNGKRKTDDRKISNLKIYRAMLEDGEWKHITELPFNSDEYSNEHPTLSADGTKLYFSSDRPGGFGSFDIYEVTIQSDDSYGAPINLGALINTDKKEQFPFISSDGALYFSSNGHPGFGLLDVFISKSDNGVWQHPDNLGLPVNSGYDDFSYVLNNDGKTGYFASNRPTGKGSDDIYKFTVTKELTIENCKQYITGTITDRTTTLPLAGVNVLYLDNANNLIMTVTTKEDGAFSFDADCETAYTLKAEKAGYESNMRNIITDKVRSATKDASMDLYSITEREKTQTIAKQKKLAEEKARAEALAIKKLEEEKKAKQLLAQRTIEEKERKEKERLQEKVRAEQAVAKKIENALASETALVKETDRTIIKTEEIHFDYSLWYLRRESRERLKTVIDVMKNNPGMIIEIGTHTDIRGNGKYNKELSQKRADSAKEFLVKNGIESGRIVSKGYGESKPIVKCATEQDCSEEDHEWNRRCEFVVIGWDYDSKNP